MKLLLNLSLAAVALAFFTSCSPKISGSSVKQIDQKGASVVVSLEDAERKYPNFANILNNSSAVKSLYGSSQDIGFGSGYGAEGSGYWGTARMKCQTGNTKCSGGWGSDGSLAMILPGVFDMGETASVIIDQLRQAVGKESMNEWHQQNFTHSYSISEVDGLSTRLADKSENFDAKVLVMKTEHQTKTGAKTINTLFFLAESGKLIAGKNENKGNGGAMESGTSQFIVSETP